MKVMVKDMVTKRLSNMDNNLIKSFNDTLNIDSDVSLSNIETDGDSNFEDQEDKK